MLAYISLFISLIALASPYFAWRALKQARQWEKVKSTPAFVDAKRADELIAQVDAQLLRLNVGLGTALNDADVGVVRADDIARRAVDRLLAHFDRLAAAVRVGAIDNDFAYQLCVYDVLALREQYSAYIRAARLQAHDPEFMAELSRLSTAWNNTKALRRDDALRRGTALDPKTPLNERL
jgi:hypothetical protein